ncbi:hypothetical protein MNO14_05310 [Luteimonas sp. S4-F44]|uniref:hypothetical protein n=1 Tax=Luteimonas sp. S4-F44 TaxID=2925842 RepID=UPI001F532B43|nr:hypothetical protein [Luteimonas sp. S4-F44]UNK43500.1 hypothetical protein MNO14_05310 [Luteimonas sp. S4-F44]
MRPALVLPLLLAATAVHAQSDREVAERAIAIAADVCPGHSNASTGPTVRAVPVGALRVLAERGAVLCPDRRLQDAAVAFYPRFGVFTWNPEVPASAQALVQVVDAVTRSGEFPAETAVWNAAGVPLQGQVVPMFEPRPNAPLNRALQR